MWCWDSRSDLCKGKDCALKWRRLWHPLSFGKNRLYVGRHGIETWTVGDNLKPYNIKWHTWQICVSWRRRPLGSRSIQRIPVGGDWPWADTWVLEGIWKSGQEPALEVWRKEGQCLEEAVRPAHRADENKMRSLFRPYHSSSLSDSNVSSTSRENQWESDEHVNWILFLSIGKLWWRSEVS